MFNSMINEPITEKFLDDPNKVNEKICSNSESKDDRDFVKCSSAFDEMPNALLTNTF